jgi:hypothetical protein
MKLNNIRETIIFLFDNFHNRWLSESVLQSLTQSNNIKVLYSIISVYNSIFFAPYY